MEKPFRENQENRKGQSRPHPTRHGNPSERPSLSSRERVFSVMLDADDAMLSKARSEHPGIAFVQADATAPGLGGIGEPFDACISNAALHWMIPQDQVLANATEPQDGYFTVPKVVE